MSKTNLLKKTANLIYSAYFFTIFVVVSEVYYWLGVIFGGRDVIFWRRHGVRVLDAIFFLTCLRVRIDGLENLAGGPTVFCANHESYLDGLIISYVLRRPFVALTAPYGEFPLGIGRWFRRMDYISVARDEFEELKYHDAVRHAHAIDLCVARLKKGESLMLFPEGKRELHRRLLPFHAGVAKIALQARVPVQPMTIKGAGQFFPVGSFLIHPTEITVVIEPAIKLWQYQTDLAHELLLVEQIIAKHLPKRYLPSNPNSLLPENNLRRAAFFDLDGTLTRGNIFELLMGAWLVKHLKLLNLSHVFRALIGGVRLKHAAWYLQVMRGLEGISVAEFIAPLKILLKTEHEHERLFFPEILSLLKRHREEGNELILITEEPEQIARPIAEILGMTLLATTLEVKDGVFTGRVQGKIMKDEEKRAALERVAEERGLDCKKSFCYGNSEHDLAMLKAVTHATLVNPNHALKRKGEALGMHIMRT